MYISLTCSRYIVSTNTDLSNEYGQMAAAMFTVCGNYILLLIYFLAKNIFLKIRRLALKHCSLQRWGNVEMHWIMLCQLRR